MAGKDGIFRLIACFFAILTAGNVMAQDEKEYTTKIEVDPASKARIEFLEGSWDFGSVPKGYTVYHNFALRNVGTDTLIITRVKPTCGCTAAPLSADHIAPGDTAEIAVSFKTAKLEGRVKKYVNVDCNDPINPYYKITFDAVVGDPEQIIAADPVAADFGDFTSGENPEIALRIINSGSSPAELNVIDKLPDDQLTVSLEKSILATKDSTTLRLRIAARVNPGPFASSITLESAGSPQSRTTIPIIGRAVE